MANSKSLHQHAAAGVGVALPYNCTVCGAPALPATAPLCDAHVDRASKTLYRHAAASVEADLSYSGAVNGAVSGAFDFGATLVCGVDEAGRGPLAGPVYAAAVILDPQRPIDGLRDSKKLTAAKREALSERIRRDALAWSIAHCTAAEIDELNILQATMLAMRRAIEGLSVQPELALIDGNRCPVCTVRTEAIIKGDDKVAEISAASILAKTARDAALITMHALYPQYAFDQHKGYPTALHLERLRLHGVTPEHRRSYAPVRAVLS